jgi:hypothetical protein
MIWRKEKWILSRLFVVVVVIVIIGKIFTVIAAMTMNGSPHWKKLKNDWENPSWKFFTSTIIGALMTVMNGITPMIAYAKTIVLSVILKPNLIRVKRELPNYES